MGLTVILRGFKVPIAVLDRFLASNGVDETHGTPPRLFYLPGECATELDPQSARLRAKLAVLAGGGGGDTSVTESQSQARLFIPQREGHARSTYGYVAYAYTMVYGQRMIDLARELPDRAPPGFAELRREILGFAENGEEALLRVAGMQGPGGVGGEDGAASSLFIVVVDEREFPLERTFMRESDLRCDHCAAVFDYWYDLLYHQRDAHGVELRNSLPLDL